MASETLPQIVCTWTPKWLSRYDRGVVTRAPRGVTDIYRRRSTGLIRIYATTDLHNQVIMVNDKEIRVEARGRWGKLYLEVR